MLGHDAGFKRQLVAAGVQRHDHFFQRGVSRPLPIPLIVHSI